MQYLEGHGVPRAEAEAHAEAADRYLFPQLATKADIEALRLATKADLSDLKLATRADLSDLKLDLTVRVLAIIGLLNGMLFALIKLT